MALLEAKRVFYDIEYIELRKKAGWFGRASPHGQMRILFADGGGNPVFPTDPVKKAHDRAWSSLASRLCLVQCSALRSPYATTPGERETLLRTPFRKIEERLGDTPFAFGKSIGMVDIAWLPLLHRAAINKDHTGYNLPKGNPRTRRRQESLLATGLADQSVSEDFEERFATFYLRESTDLGRLASNRTGRARTGPPDCCVGEAVCGCQFQCNLGVRKPASGSGGGLAWPGEARQSGIPIRRIGRRSTRREASHPLACRTMPKREIQRIQE